MSIKVQHLNKQIGIPPVSILTDINLTINDGDFISISGRSGSGKSTLLYILSTLDLPSSGNLLIDNKHIGSMSVEDLHRFRNLNLGFVFQFHYLLPELSALENVLMPARKTGLIAEKTPEAIELFDLFGLSDKLHKLPGQLSGGEQQRVAIARALIMKPRYIFADEPTGNLDSLNGNIVMKILQNANKEWKTTLVLVTHEPEYASLASKIIYLKDGCISTPTNRLKKVQKRAK
jgi:putative ABC transport system ATP-binding protein/lipoprotein-releasing system ATP-binding protein